MLVFSLAVFSAPPAYSDDGEGEGIQRVRLISIDGMDGVDFANRGKSGTKTNGLFSAKTIGGRADSASGQSDRSVTRDHGYAACCQEYRDGARWKSQPRVATAARNVIAEVAESKEGTEILRVAETEGAVPMFVDDRRIPMVHPTSEGLHEKHGYSSFFSEPPVSEADSGSPR